MLWKIDFKSLSDKIKNKFTKGDSAGKKPAPPSAPAKAAMPAMPKPPAAPRQENTVLNMIPEEDIYAGALSNPSLRVREDDNYRHKQINDILSPLNAQSEDIILKPLGEDHPEIKRNRKVKFVGQIFKDLLSGIVVALCAVACGILLAESYITKPAPVYAWLAFIPFTIAIFNIRSALFSLIFGWLTGGIFYFIAINWISVTVLEGTGDQSLAMTSLTALSILLSVQFALFSLGAYYLKRVPMAWPFATACLWVGLEILHQLIALKFMAFPWFVLGYTQFNFTYLIQISSYAGVYGVSFVVMFTSLVLGFLTLRINRIVKVFYFILAFCLVLFVLSMGHKTIREQLNYLQASPQTLRVALMQPYTHKLFIQGYNEDVVYTIAGQLEALKDKKASFIIWPESSLPGDLFNNEYMDFVKEQSASLKAWQLFGGTEEGADGDYVSAVLVNESGITDAYRKTELVPFGEFLPFKTLLGGFYKSHNITSLTGTFKEGTQPGKVLNFTMEIPDKVKKEEYNFGVEICFESIFPSVYRAQAMNGADFFVNISNDGWFMNTAAAYQHLRANVFRAVENRRPLLRSTNTGISAWIDSLGKIRFETGLDRQESSVFNFVFKERDSKTFYTMHGDIFAYACLAISLGLVLFSMAFLSARDEYRD